jgi:hypothetical protein
VYEFVKMAETFKNMKKRYEQKMKDSLIQMGINPDFEDKGVKEEVSKNYLRTDK